MVQFELRRERVNLMQNACIHLNRQPPPVISSSPVTVTSRPQGHEIPLEDEVKEVGFKHFGENIATLWSRGTVTNLHSTKCTSLLRCSCSTFYFA